MGLRVVPRGGDCGDCAGGDRRGSPGMWRGWSLGVVGISRGAGVSAVGLCDAGLGGCRGVSDWEWFRSGLVASDGGGD